MLKINYATDINDRKKMDPLFNAVHYEANTMIIAANNDAIAICNNKIENKSGRLTEIQIEAEKAKKADLEKHNRKLKEENDGLHENWKAIVTAISGASKEFEKDGVKTVVTNDETAVRNVLRLTACADNRKFFNYAILTSCDNFAQFYDNFMHFIRLTKMHLKHVESASIVTATTKLLRLLKERFRHLSRKCSLFPLRTNIQRKLM